LADSIADAFGVSRESIELRLKNIRAAARARTEIRKSDVMEEEASGPIQLNLISRRVD
jgi:hypothetical protein